MTEQMLFMLNKKKEENKHKDLSKDRMLTDDDVKQLLHTVSEIGTNKFLLSQSKCETIQNIILALATRSTSPLGLLHSGLRYRNSLSGRVDFWATDHTQRVGAHEPCRK